MVSVKVYVDEELTSVQKVEVEDLRSFIISNVTIRNPYCTKTNDEFRKETEIILDKLNTVDVSERNDIILYGNEERLTCLYKIGNTLEFIYCFYEKKGSWLEEDSQVISFFITQL